MKAIEEEKNRKILVFHIGTIGDILLTLPIFAAIRRHYPLGHITLLSVGREGEKYIEDLLPKTGYFDAFENISSFDPKHLAAIPAAIWKLRRQRFSCAYYLLRDEPESPRRLWRDSLFFRLLGITKIYGNRFITDFTDKKALLPNVTENYFRRLLQTGGLKSDADHSFSLNFSESEMERIRLFFREMNCAGKMPVAVGIGGKKQCCRWPVAKYEELLRRMCLDGRTFPILFGGPADWADCRRLLDQLPAGSCGHCINRDLSLRETILALAGCSFYCGNDTGTIHMAAAAGLCCIGLYSSAVYAGMWYPQGERNIIIRKDFPCSVCLRPECDSDPARCIDAISVDEVWFAVRNIIEN